MMRKVRKVRKCNIVGCRHNVTHMKVCSEHIDIGSLMMAGASYYCDQHITDELMCMLGSWDGYVVFKRVAQDRLVVVDRCSCMHMVNNCCEVYTARAIANGYVGRCMPVRRKVFV